MPSAAGLSATYGGYQQARKQGNDIEKGDIENETARTAQKGQALAGDALPILQQMLQPGATPMPPMGGGAPFMAGPAPQAPPPGQASQPMQPGPQPQMLGSPPPPNDPTMSVAPSQANAAPPGSVGDRFGGLPGGNAPPPQQSAPPASLQPQAPPRQQPGPQPDQQTGRFNLPTIMAAVVKAGHAKGATPAEMMAAVTHLLPSATAQGQLDYKNLMIQLGNTKAQETATHHAVTEGQTDEKTASGERIAGAKIVSAEKRNELTNQTKLAVSTLSTNTRKEIAEMLDAGRTGRTQLSVDARKEIALLNADSRAEIAAALDAGRTARTTATLKSQEGRTAATLESREKVAAGHDTAAGERADKRNEFTSERLRLQAANLDRQITRDGQLQDNARNRQTLKLMEDENNAEFKRSQQKISAQNVFAPNKSKEQLTKDAETSYQNARQRIEKYKAAMGNKGAAAPAEGDTPPIESLKEGHVTTFSNGQKWTIKDGKPFKVDERSGVQPSLLDMSAHAASPGDPNKVYDPFGNTKKNKLQGRVPPSIYPPPS